MSPFRKSSDGKVIAEKSKSAVYIVLDEDSLQARRQKLRVTGSFDQVAPAALVCTWLAHGILHLGAVAAVFVQASH